MQYEIKYIRNDMPKAYVGKTVKYARSEEEAIKFLCGSKPDKQGYFRMKRGGRGKIQSIKQLKEKEND